jgi:hypothetical protein
MFQERQTGDRKIRWSGKILFLAAGIFLAGCGEVANLAWVPQVAGPNDIFIDGYGVNDWVTQLPNGALPITLVRTIVNNGSATITAPYNIHIDVYPCNFLAVVGSGAGYTPQTQAIFSCDQAGPSLKPGESQPVTFRVVSPSCPPNPHPVPNPLPCGLYQSVFRADTGKTIKETNESDNDGPKYFYVPSLTQKINIALTLNPGLDANLLRVPPRGVDILAYQICVPPGPTPWAGATHTFNITTIPAGGTYTVNGKTPRAFTPIGSGSTGTLVGLVPNSPTVTFNVNVPDTCFKSACNSLTSLGQEAYVESASPKITVISTDGCVIAQREGIARIVFRCQ